uniref:Glycosyltransferase family 2 protein n=1 Tax=Thermodesulfobacterium geofontis TaxID=1295609 RepID=A0A7C4NRN7_9BACT
MIKFYLILATLGRYKEVDNFLYSLRVQTYRNFELIVVDQNDSIIIDDIIKKYSSSFPIHHIKIKEKGLSLARNVGLRYINSIIKNENNKEIIIAFPDDDCEYPSSLFEDVLRVFRELDNSYNIITGISIDKQNKLPSSGKWKDSKCEINCKNIFQTMISYTIFIKISDILDIFFDEKLGVGTFFSSAEETDFVYRMLKNGYKGFYYPEKIIIYHPLKGLDYKNPKDRQRAYTYGMGMGAFFKKHLVKNKDLSLLPSFIKYFFIRPIGGMFLGLAKFNISMFLYYKNVLKGRWTGLLRYC